MAKITNYAAGPRGITLKDGSTVWLNPGQSEDIKKDDIAGELPDLGRPPEEQNAADGDLAALQQQVADLTKQVETLEGEKAEPAKAGAAAVKEAETVKKANIDLTKQVETLSKPK